MKRQTTLNLFNVFIDIRVKELNIGPVCLSQELYEMTTAPPPLHPNPGVSD